jgi:capsular polysaccharide biosynthesis protein
MSPASTYQWVPLPAALRSNVVTAESVWPYEGIQLTLLKLTDGSIYGSGIVTRSDSLITSESLGLTRQDTTEGYWRSPFQETGDGRLSISRPLRPLQVDEPAFLLSQGGDEIYGHWLLDLIPKTGWRHRHRAAWTAWIVSTRAPKQAIEFLGRQGIPRQSLVFYDPMQEHVQCKDLWFSTLPRHASGLHLPAIQGVFPVVRGHTTVRQKYFLSRAQWPNPFKRCHNRTALEALFRDAGYQIIHPQDLSEKEQIALYATASHLAGEYGSALHNSVFCPPGTEVICLHHPAASIWIQEQLCRAYSQHCVPLAGRVVGDQEQPHWRGEWEVDLETLRTRLARG